MEIKTKQQLRDQIGKDLAKIAAFWHTTYGVSLELFQSWLAEKCHTVGDEMLFIANVKKAYPALWPK